jgi:CxxC-x17-CxxC domain-containing protein
LCFRKYKEGKDMMRDQRRSAAPRRDFGPREMHKATCSECGKECEVPFKPADGRPVFCKDCFMKKKKY